MEHQRVKAERQAELAVAAALARTAAEDEAKRLRAKFARSDKGTALLKAAHLKMELEACREKLAAAEAGLKDQVCGLKLSQTCQPCPHVISVFVPVGHGHVTKDSTSLLLCFRS